ncbi:MAG: MATE family efflux transporter [Chlorobi bacterium]|nr:MATE family efflux transporter [Chlorobiota bacterium]
MNKYILKLALPNILTNLTVPLLGMVDMHLMGYLDSAVYMGAIALGGVIFNLVYWGFAFLRMSISGIAAQEYGKKDSSGMANTLFRGLLLAIGGALLLLLLQTGIEKVSFLILDGSPEVKNLAREYFYIRIWAAPAAISLMVFYGWFLGMQNAIYPMIIAVTVNIVNILLSFLFVRSFEMKVDGVALGSMISQYFGLLMAVIFFLKKYKYILNEFSFSAIIDGKGIKNFLNVSGDIFIRTACIILVFTFFTSESAGFNDIILAANSALLQFLFLFSYFLDGFAYAAEALVGKFFGAKDYANLKKVIRLLMFWGLGFGILFSALYYFAGDELLVFFTKHENVLTEGRKYLPWIITLPLISFASYIWDGVYIGTTASKLMKYTMLAATFVFFITYYLAGNTLHNHALWLAMLLFSFMRSFLQFIFYPKATKSV